ncbi:hypothetical protein AQJ43_02350 [Streptomyces avermitilis]|uniref:Uncharacterized protein n=2 Tax=Streptomyces avermitilis TaxID=33903 RepID=Q82I91_STRAW|nr:hypothetical protein [Streptomyces avermitilis]MYS98867.1 hypothetical protein [Streptomyces sp. SID5469]KUN56466.1 hypothetical protein AQJ43_02350 [Streptomyces avermitilis]OOV32808.1 hypothetical protein SM007_08430 [Streptomyces avermitilis]BAC70978.1 hypothetical protein SAVERM_3267 [Streptomyces avermitilis MA-4680 = NBRC 14893]BBJ51137.1 hypothetical protein SAVMC3_37660 [Streptomyces avermitilis]
MEQRIGSNSQPLDVAAVDPAFIPGLTPTVSAEPKSTAEPEGAAEPEKAAEAADEASPEDKTSEEAPAGKAAQKPSLGKASGKVSDEADDEPADEAEEEPAEEADDEADTEGPAFEASDRRASIVADGRGVRLRLDDQEAEFRWDEIGAVETESPRFGKRFTITVHTPDRRWYPIEIEASSRSRFKEWETKLDEVLDAYFQE